MAGSLSGSTTTVAGSTVFNLSSPAQTDWIQFPKSITSVNRKSGGGSTIGLPTAIGPHSTSGTDNFAANAETGYGVTWTDGTPTASATNDQDYVWAPNSGGSTSTGDGWQFTLPADTNSRTAHIYWSLFGGSSGTVGTAAQVVATLSDGSAAALTISQATPGVNGGSFCHTTLTYNAASAGQTLTVTITLTTNPGTWSNVTMEAASYLASSSDSATVASALGALSTSGSASQSVTSVASSALGALASQATAVVTAIAVASSTFGGLSSSGVATQSRAAVSSSSLSLSTSAAATQSQSAAGAGILGPLAASITATEQPPGSAVITSALGALSSSGNATQAQSSVASSSLSLSTAATATQKSTVAAGSAFGALSTAITALDITADQAVVSGALGALATSAFATQANGVSAAGALSLSTQVSASRSSAAAISSSPGTLQCLGIATQSQAAAASGKFGPLATSIAVVPPYTASVSGTLGPLGTSAVVTFGAPSYPVDPLHYVHLAYRAFYAPIPSRSFYAAAPQRTFYVKCYPMANTSNTPPVMSPKDPRESVVLTFDATQVLNGATLTGTSTPSISTEMGTDKTASLVLSNIIVNTVPVTVETSTGATVTIAAGCAVQAEATAGAFGSEYLIAIPCQTSNPQFSPVLKAILPMDNQ